MSVFSYNYVGVRTPPDRTRSCACVSEWPVSVYVRAVCVFAVSYGARARLRVASALKFNSCLYSILPSADDAVEETVCCLAQPSLSSSSHSVPLQRVRGGEWHRA